MTTTESKPMSTPLFTVNAARNADTKEVTVSTEFNGKLTGAEAITILGTVIKGMAETAMKLGQSIGMSEGDVTSLLFAEDSE